MLNPFYMLPVLHGVTRSDHVNIPPCFSPWPGTWKKWTQGLWIYIFKSVGPNKYFFQWCCFHEVLFPKSYFHVSYSKLNRHTRMCPHRHTCVWRYMVRKGRNFKVCHHGSIVKYYFLFMFFYLTKLSLK